MHTQSSEAAWFEMRNNHSILSCAYLCWYKNVLIIYILGQGGFGHVVLCKNKLDGRQYAMKKIRLKDKILPLNDRIVRFVSDVGSVEISLTFCAEN